MLSSDGRNQKTKQKAGNRGPFPRERAGYPVVGVGIACCKSTVHDGGEKEPGVDLPAVKEVEDQNASQRHQGHGQGQKRDEKHA